MSPEQLAQVRAQLAEVTQQVNTRLRGRLITPDQTQEIMGDRLFRGADAANKLYGTNLTPDIVAQIPFKFTEAEAQNALGLGTPISLHVKEFGQGKDARPATMLNLNDHVAGTALYEVTSSWYKDEDFAKKIADNFEWRQTTADVVPGTLGEDFLVRTDLTIKYLREEFFKGLPLPAHYEQAIQEWNAERPNIEPLVKNWSEAHKTEKLPNGKPAPNWYIAAKMLEKLQIVQLLRPTPTSILQDITNAKAAGIPMLQDTYTDTSVLDSNGCVVIVGSADSSGAGVRSYYPHSRAGLLGSSLSRGLSE